MQVYGRVSRPVWFAYAPMGQAVSQLLRFIIGWCLTPGNSRSNITTMNYKRRLTGVGYCATGGRVCWESGTISRCAADFAPFAGKSFDPLLLLSWKKRRAVMHSKKIPLLSAQQSLPCLRDDFPIRWVASSPTKISAAIVLGSIECCAGFYCTTSQPLVSAPTFAWAAAMRAIGTRNGLHET